MTRIPFYQVDAFANATFKGNQAAIMPVDSFPDADLMQAIAAENNIAETAFIVGKQDGGYAIRWFTPTMEVPLCGHATLAAAHMVFTALGHRADAVTFSTLEAGELTVKRLGGDRYEMDFPADPPTRCDVPVGLAEALGTAPDETWAGDYLVSVFNSAADVRALTPDIAALAPIGGPARRGPGNHICVAPGDNEFDVVSRFFAPGSGIPEDPATGSAHCIIAPLFSDKLGKPELTCFQAYPRRGAVIATRMSGARVFLSGKAVTVIEGQFYL